MSKVIIEKAAAFKGEIVPPPDKSISHRSVFFCSIAEGTSRVGNFLFADDPVSSINAFRSLGIRIDEKRNRGELIIHGKGLHGLTEPQNVIDCGNSGTTMRLLTGLLSGNPFLTILTGDRSLRQRPMARVIDPCTEMGAYIRARDHNRYPPIAILGKKLLPLTFQMPVASAQLKSALMLASLYADGVTHVIEPAPSRDHTERMLPSFGAEIAVAGRTISVSGEPQLKAQDLEVPGDFSSAAFFMVAALIVEGGEVVLRNCGVNPTRTGLIDVIKRMNGKIALENKRVVSGEPVADIVCSYSPNLRATKISGDEVPLLIDEFPIVTVLATQAEGLTTICNAEELRVKESDRIHAMAENLRSLGVELAERDDGMEISGKAVLKGGKVQSYHDHRIAMSMAVAGLIAEDETEIDETESVAISFPGFFDILKSLIT